MFKTEICVLVLIVSIFSIGVNGNEIPCTNSGNTIELQPIASDCRKFLVCVLNVGTEVLCPNGTYFDASALKCDHRDNVECVIDNGNCNPVCVAADGAERLPSEENCTEYLSCVDRCIGTMESCAAGLHFNPTLQECDSADHAECLLEVCSSNAENQWKIIASVNSCRKYYFCFGDRALAQDCGEGSFFDQETMRCELSSPENPCEVIRPPTPPASVIEQCTPAIDLAYIPHPDNPAVYYRCLNGTLTVRQCPPGLVFDVHRQQCNKLKALF